MSYNNILIIEIHVNIDHSGKHWIMAEKKIQKFDSRSCPYDFKILWTLSNNTVI